VLAFAAIYLIWGSTYLAIRWTVETLPPLLTGGVRFIVAGTLLYAFARVSGAERPSTAQWRAATIAGALMLAGGTGSVMVAEQWVPSGLAALLIAAMPLWMVTLDWLGGRGGRPSGRTVAGLLAGIAGVTLLIGSPGVGGGGRPELFGALLILGGSVLWAGGSLYARYAATPPRPMMWVALQMLAGGGVLACLGILHGDVGTLDLSGVAVRSWLALAYLVGFGAIVAYTAYVWLLGVVTPARVSTYAFVNPVVAMILGAILADEPIGFRAVVAAAIILGGVLLITLDRGRPERAPGPSVATEGRHAWGTATERPDPPGERAASRA
jgi:drug/metabolite transporter (DMT)-like permease